MGAMLRVDADRCRASEAIRSGVVLEDEDRVDERREWARACMDKGRLGGSTLSYKRREEGEGDDVF